ncbi:MAG: glycosyltransferase involved in cell wall biosynthesis [Oleispira sp.]
MVAVGRDMCELLSLKVKGNSRVHYIPNWADHNGVDLISKNDSKVLKKLNLTQSKSIIFQFFGNIGRLQDVYGLLEAIKLTKAKNSKFIFIGNGSEADAIDSIIQNGMDDRIHFYGKCEMSEKDHALSACDVAFVSLKEGMRGLAVPSKSYFSLAANKPIIVVGDDGSELRQLVDDYPIGWGCSSGKPILLAKLIDDICQNPNQLLSMSPRESLVNHFSEAKSLNEIKKLILTYM